MVHKTQSESSPVQSFDEVMKVGTHNMEAFARSYESFFEKAGKVNGETLDFWARRLKEDFELPAKIAHCQAPEQVAEAYTQFFSKMFTDYSEQTQRVMSLVSEMAMESAELAQDAQYEEIARTPETKTKRSAA